VRIGVLSLLFLGCISACFARETVYLSSGFTIAADSHTQSDGMYVFRIGSGTLEYPASQVREIVSLPDEPQPKPHTVQGVALEPKSIVKTAAATEGLDELFMRAVAKVESGLRQDAVSRKGAIGLMQLMPDTASELGVDPKQADQNASGGARYLRDLLERYHYNPVLALAAYNAGPGAVTKYRGVPPYYETRTYVVRVLKEYEKQLRLAAIRPDAVKAEPVRTPNATN
jgi:soluble lytic murein transglycosylase-like protein